MGKNGTKGLLEDEFLEEVVKMTVRHYSGEILESRNTDFSDFGKRISEVMEKLGIKTGVMSQFDQDIQDKLGLTAKKLSKLPRTRVSISHVEADVALEEWIGADDDLEFIHKDSYRGDGSVEKSDRYLIIDDSRRIMHTYSMLLRYKNTPLVVTYQWDMMRHGWFIEAIGESGSDFLLKLEAKVEQYLIDKYKGKVLNQALREIAVKKYRREELVYPPELESKIDGMLKSFRKWHASDKINKWGYLFIGGPGTGKTTIGGLLAGERKADCTFLYCPAGEITGPDHLAKIFHWAKLFSPTILQIDDIDLISRQRSKWNGQTSFTSVLLENLDGLCKEGKLFTILTTNDPSGIDNAIRNRAGRISNKVVFGGFGQCLPKLITRYAKEFGMKVYRKDIAKAVKSSAELIKDFTPDEVKNMCEGIHLASDGNIMSLKDIEDGIKKVHESFHDQGINRSYL